jgi:mono/diheme cytochrome c family protein
MPSFADKSSEKEILALLAYVQNLWSDETYTIRRREQNIEPEKA